MVHPRGDQAVRARERDARLSRLRGYSGLMYGLSGPQKPYSSTREPQLLIPPSSSATRCRRLAPRPPTRHLVGAARLPAPAPAPPRVRDAPARGRLSHSAVGVLRERSKGSDRLRRSYEGRLHVPRLLDERQRAADGTVTRRQHRTRRKEVNDMRKIPASHVAAVVGYWLVLLGLLGEFGTAAGQENGSLPVIFTAWIALGIWRVIRKRRRRNRLTV